MKLKDGPGRRAYAFKHYRTTRTLALHDLDGQIGVRI